MPTMSGTVFLDRVKDLSPDTFPIVVSGHTGLRSVKNAINRRVIHRCCTKLSDYKDLRDNIRDAFRHYRLSPDILLEQRGTEVHRNEAASCLLQDTI